MGAVRAKYQNGVLMPLEPLELEDGAEVMVSVEAAASVDGRIAALRASAGGWKGSRDPEELKRMIYQARSLAPRQYGTTSPFSRTTAGTSNGSRT